MGCIPLTISARCFLIGNDYFLIQMQASYLLSLLETKEIYFHLKILLRFQSDMKNDSEMLYSYEKVKRIVKYFPKYFEKKIDFEI